MRIVTTLPSATEIVCALGFEPVGVSHECDHPPSVESIPAVTRSRIDADTSSGEIDRQVREHAEEGVYEVDVGTLDSLEPDLIVTQGMCEVCAVDEAEIERAVEEINEARRASSSRTQSDEDGGPEILTTDPHTIADVLGDVERIGREAGRESHAKDVVSSLRKRLSSLRERTAAVEARPRTVVLDWTNPPMVAGHWVPELVTAAGGEYGMADPADRSTPREWGDVLAYDPEVVIVAPCGFGLEETARNLADLTDREGWDDLTAVRDGRVWAMDGNHYVNRPGPRIVDTAEYLTRIVHADRFEAPPPEAAVPLADLERGPEA